MRYKRLKNLGQVFLFVVFLSTGCAHKPVSSLQPSSNDVSMKQDRQIVEVAKESSSSSPDIQDDFEDDFFDEEFEAHQVQVADPLSAVNKGIFYFNDKLYFWALKPLAKGYRAITPVALRKGINNIFYNLMMPIRFVNCILQGKGKAAGSEVSLFIINTTVGFLGFSNLADLYPELNITDAEDLGQTFGKYGMGNGFYIMWPVLGPSTLRDSLGMLGDYFLNPLSYINPLGASLAVKGVDLVNKTSLHIGEYEALKESAIDPYVAVRNSYLQFRDKKVLE